MVDASVGALRIKSTDDLNFTGNATLGYATPKLGLVGSAWYSKYILNNAQQKTDSWRFEGQGEGWFLTGSQSNGTRFELRATGGGIHYDSQFDVPDPNDPKRSLLFIEESIWMGRGTLFAGLFTRPSDHFRLEVILGGGFQYVFLEDHLDARPGAPLILDDTDSLSIQGQARLGLRWSFLPGTLGTRLNARAHYFTINRATATLNPTTNNFDVTVEEQTQFELFSKLFVDVEALSFFGITPGAYAGLDLVRASGTVDLSTTVPSAGLGLFRDIQ